MKISVFTLGCKVNMSESASIMNALAKDGHEVSDKPEFADVYVLNTCAVTGEAEKKSRQAVARLRKFNPLAPVIVTGCASENSPDGFAQKERVVYVGGARKKSEILDIIRSGDFGMRGGTAGAGDDAYEELGIPSGGRVRADIKIQDGCNNFCSYCIIPYLRGRERSRDARNIIEEIEVLRPLEAVLTGINISSYDKSGEGLSGLLRQMQGLNCRIRLGSLEVGVIEEKLLDAAAKLKDFAPHFHLSLQSGSGKVLADMNRKYTPETYMEKVELIRSYYPQAAITTDVIAGFPTETEGEFEKSLKFAESVGFSDLHCFTYSPRSGTKSASLKDLPFAVKKERTDRLLLLGGRLKKRFLDSCVGKTEKLIAEETRGGYTCGYGSNYVKYYVKGNLSGFVKVKGAERYGDGLLGEIIE